MLVIFATSSSSVIVGCIAFLDLATALGSLNTKINFDTPKSLKVQNLMRCISLRLKSSEFINLSSHPTLQTLIVLMAVILRFRQMWSATFKLSGPQLTHGNGALSAGAGGHRYRLHSDFELVLKQAPLYKHILSFNPRRRFGI